MQILFAIVFGLLSFSPQQEYIYPEKPNAHILDEAEVVEDSTQKQLESFLRSYRDSTGNYIEVVTVKSLDGQTIEQYAVGLFRAWGIGNQNLDRDGVLLLVAPNEQKARIEVGYDMEGDLTDLVSNRIMEETLVPAFKKGNFSAGIKAGTHKIAEQLSPASIKERKERRAGQKEKLRSIFRSIGVGLLIILILVVFLWVVRIVFRWWRENRRLSRLREEARDKISELRQRADETEEEIEGYLNEKEDAFSLDRHRHFVQDLESTLLYSESPLGLEILRAELDAAEELIVDDPEAALSKLEPISVAPIAEEVKQKADNRLKEVESARKVAPDHIERVKQELQQVREHIQDVRNSGFKLGDIPKPLDQAPERVQVAEKKLAQSPDDPLAAVDKLNRATELISSVKNEVDELVELHRQNEEDIEGVSKSLEELRAAHESQADDLRTKLQQNLPAGKRERLLDELAAFDEQASELSELLSEARAANSMETQNFTGARDLIDDAFKILGSLKDTLTEPRRILNRVAEARDEIPLLQEEVANLEEEAAELMDNNDVDSHARDLFDEAIKERKEAKAKVSASPPDVLAAEKLYNQAAETFENAIQQAEEDIEEAERRRRRQRRDSTDTAAGLSAGAGMGSSDGVSTSGSGFGGMGGGMSGGGGATGSW